ncbi:hypothetical protein SFRURICE_020096 [Spodoptera frugiperda]|nr:hypothetical protein SFRURICE_020096 [Spodoptera frugiperda]
MEKSDNKTKTMWNIIKQKTKKPQKNIGNNISLKYNNQTINCPETISNLFNEYFTTVGLNPNDTNQSHNKKVEDTHNVNTRHKNRLYLPPSRIKMLNQSPYYMAVKIFNKLPKDLQNETKETIFTRKLKKILIQKCFYSIKEFFEEKQNNKIKCQN